MLELGCYHKYSRRKNTIQEMTSDSLLPEMFKLCEQNHICRFKREGREKEKDDKVNWKSKKDDISKSECAADHQTIERRGFQV